ncbi:transforming growth factor beta activator LRRC33-like [Hoplias malabaricus]|uniref:transforming growth factor beta activator LRRC33-like n=1 Tax=Hoplias malabaricus TaxID=27720 RepID=UPI003461F139
MDSITTQPKQRLKAKKHKYLVRTTAQMAVYFIGLLSLYTLCTTALSPATSYRHQQHNLLELSWSNQNLYSIPVELDQRLQVLDLSNNAIEQLNVLNLKALEKLDLSYNHLSFIEKEAFKDLIHLESINLAMNLLDSNVINNSNAFQNLYGLKHLDISLNNLDDSAVGLYIHNATALEQLSLTGNSLTRLTPSLFANNRNLVNIDMENNNILVVDEGTFEFLEKLSALNLARNNLIHVCDFQLHQVTFLNLSRNSIEFFFTNRNEQMYLLEILDLSYNNLVYFPIVPTRNRLKYLHLQYNKLGALGLEISISEAKELHRNINQNIEIHNKDNSTDLNLLTLHYIDLSANNLKDFSLTSLGKLSFLEVLNLSTNCLQNVSYGIKTEINQTEVSHFSLPSLHYINLQNNDIEYLPKMFFNFFPKLKTLVLSQNHIKLCVGKVQLPTDSCVSFREIHSLRNLDLGENGIKAIVSNNFAGTHLVSLNLSGNQNIFLGTGALKYFQGSLKSLSIANIKASTLNASTPCMTRPRTLNISFNRFEDLPESFRCSPLKVLDLRNNNFTSLNFLLKDMPQDLEFMYISDNPYNCCNTKWLRVLYEKHVSVVDLDRAKCKHKYGIYKSIHFLQNHTIQCQRESFQNGSNIVWILIPCLIFILVVVVLVKLIFAKASHIV